MNTNFRQRWGTFYIIGLLLNSLLLACQNAEKTPSAKDGSENGQIEEKTVIKQKENIELITKYYEYLVKRDREQLAEIWSTMPENFEKDHTVSKVNILEVYPSGDKYVITRIRQSNLNVEVCNIFTIENGVITKVASFLGELNQYCCN